MGWIQGVIQFLKSVLASGVSQFLALAVFFLLSAFVEMKVGIIHGITKLYHKFSNSPTEIRINADYEISHSFDKVKKELKDAFREEYKPLKVFTDSSRTLEFNADNKFNVTMSKSSGNDIVVRTDKISANMRDTEKKMEKVLNTLEAFEQGIESQTKGTKDICDQTGFSVFLYLPYKETFLNIRKPNVLNKEKLRQGIASLSVPTDFEVDSYEFKLTDKTGSKVEIKQDSVNINSDNRRNLEKTISKLL